MLTSLLALFLGALLALALIGWLSDKQADAGNANLTPGLKLLPGDISWKNQSGNVQVYFPITSSIVLSVVVSLVLWLFR